MPSSAEKELRQRLRRLEVTRFRIEGLHQGGTLPRQDVERLYEGLFLSLVTGFERFLERLFFEVVLDETRHSARVLPKASFASPRTLREFVLAEKPFVDWLPYGNTEERAKMFLRKGRPFTEMPGSSKGELNRWMAIRNAIAHSSDHSRDKFHRVVIGTNPLPPRQKSPAGWLRSAAKIGVSRFELASREAAAIAHALENW
jgi:hypothetical protein